MEPFCSAFDILVVLILFYNDGLVKTVYKGYTRTDLSTIFLLPMFRITCNPAVVILYRLQEDSPNPILLLHTIHMGPTKGPPMAPTRPLILVYYCVSIC